jgi:predicted protein tyrosine phosphatase
MFKEILFLNAEEMRRLPPSLDTVVVSMLDKSEEPARPALEGFLDVLRLQFEDTYEEAHDEPPGSWPDEPVAHEYRRFTVCDGERPPMLSDARAIVEFLARHQRAPQPLRLVVHCFGGVSRSVAVANWASARFWVPIRGQSGLDSGNPRLLRLLDKAAGPL